MPSVTYEYRLGDQSTIDGILVSQMNPSSYVIFGEMVVLVGL